MKTHLLLFGAGFLVSLTGVAQVSIDQNSFPDAGESSIFSTSNELQIDFSSTGANYTWDYTSLTPAAQETVNYSGPGDLSGLASILFGSFAPTQYKITFFMPYADLPIDQLGAFLPIPINDVNVYHRKTADSLTQTGYSFDFSGTVVAFRSDTIEKVYDFPLNYGDSYASRGFTEMNLNPIMNIIWRQYRQRASEVDGWGQISTPYGTFDALRIHHTIHELDSIYANLGGGGTWLPLTVPVTHLYEWRTPSENEAILSIQTNEIAGNEQVTRVKYRDNQQWLSIPEKNPSQTQLYPNPARDALYLIPVENGNCSLYGADGRLILHRNVAAFETVSFELKGLPAGTYLLELKSNSGTEVHRVVHL